MICPFTKAWNLLKSNKTNFGDQQLVRFLDFFSDTFVFFGDQKNIILLNTFLILI